MDRMKRNILAAFFTFSMIFWLFGCGDDGGSSSSSGDEENTGGDSEANCTAEDAACLDVYQLETCVDGQIVTVNCFEEEGRYCEEGTCVDPWVFGSPTYDTACEDTSHDTTETLKEKAAYYDEIIRRLHVHPDHKLVSNVVLKEGAVEAEATLDDVQEWDTGENDGLWTDTYVASQAFRYAVTGDEQALDNIRTTFLEGTAKQHDITGVPGLYTREFRTPGIEGMECPENLSAYYPDVEKDDNKWLKIDEGCVWTVDPADDSWVKSDHCGLDDFDGYCFLDNVSQDEYAGHMLALGTLWKLVDDETIHNRAGELAEAVADHLMKDGKMEFVDWDGRVTEHGRIYAMALDNFPGFNAMLALSWFSIAAYASEREDILDWYDNCLLQRSGEKSCIDHDTETPKPYDEYLETHGLYVGPGACKTNYNNISMFFMGMIPFCMFEHRSAIVEPFQTLLEEEIMRQSPGPGERDIVDQLNPVLNFSYAAFKDLRAESSGPALQAIRDGVCTLRQFPASKHKNASNLEELYEHDCISRLDGSNAAEVIPIYERCLTSTYMWTRNPYERKICTEDTQRLSPPIDYLLAYWMGRYFGYIGEED